mgnify:CR=1 FL=1
MQPLSSTRTILDMLLALALAALVFPIATCVLLGPHLG